MSLKRVLSIVTAAALMLSLAACAGDREQELRLGNVSGNVYTNEFFGLHVEATEGFTYADDETIQAIGMATAETYAEVEDDILKNVAKDLKEGKTITDFYLSDEDYADSLNLTISYGGHGIDESMISSIIDETIPAIEEAYEAQGMRGVKCERGTTEFDGRKIPCIKTSASIELQGGAYVEIYQTQIQLVQGEYLGCLTATTYVDDKTEDMLSMAESTKE